MPRRAHTRRTIWLYRLTIVVPVMLFMIATPAVTQAHPLGNFTMNHYSRLELAPDQVRVFYVLDMAEIPAFQVIQQIDTNTNGQVDSAEGTIYATTKVAELQQGLRLTLDGTPIDLTLVGTPELSFPAGQGGLSVLRLTFQLIGALPDSSQGKQAVDYQDTNDRERIGWREIVVQGREGVHITQSSVSDQDRSNELRTYPDDMLSSPLNQTSAQFSFTASSIRSNSANTTPQQLGAAANDGAFAALITLPQLNLRVVVIALATALGLGALHALEPGHGKTAAAAYLVGAHATARHAVVLGLTITVMHTSSVFILGLITLFASRYILPERLLPWLGLASGLIVIILGLRMFLTRLRPPPFIRHDAHAHDHPHSAMHHHHDGHGHHHELPAVLTDKTVGWRGVLAIGVSGGLLPCPSALIVLLSAIGLGRIGFGLLLIVAFSAGLAMVLSGIGLVVLYGGRWLERHATHQQWLTSPKVSRLVSFLPALTGLMVIATGVLLLYNALPLLRIWGVS